MCSVGVGSDYDGVETLPKGLEDVSKYPSLVSHLKFRVTAFPWREVLAGSSGAEPELRREGKDLQGTPAKLEAPRRPC